MARDIMKKMSRSLSYLGAVDADVPDKYYFIKIGAMAYRRAKSGKMGGMKAVARYAEWLRCQGVVRISLYLSVCEDTHVSRQRRLWDHGVDHDEADWDGEGSYSQSESEGSEEYSLSEVE